MALSFLPVAGGPFGRQASRNPKTTFARDATQRKNPNLAMEV
jgi:hypothetical protein